MSEILHIKNFGPITDVKLEFKRLNVIIGENATGKSTIAKVLAVCRYFSYLLSGNIFDNPFEDGLTAWGLSEFVKNDSFIFYQCKHYSFTATRVSEIMNFPIDRDDEADNEEVEIFSFSTTLNPISNEFNSLLLELERIQPKVEGIYSQSHLGWTIPASFFQNDVSKVMENPFFFHTERGLQSLFSLGKNSIPNIADSLFNQFADFDRITKLFKNDTKIEPLDLIYRNENGKSIIRKRTENEFYDLKNGASGYKSAIPIVLVIEYYIEFRKKNKTFLIEEGELNLFPSAQNKLVHYLVDKTINYGNSILITTHSPYILTSLNNLMYAFTIGESETKASEVDRVIEKKYWVSSDDVSAYLIKQDGTSDDILNREENMIRAELIDEISTEINKEFDKLINIELGIENEGN